MLSSLMESKRLSFHETPHQHDSTDHFISPKRSTGPLSPSGKSGVSDSLMKSFGKRGGNPGFKSKLPESSPTMDKS